MSNALSVPIQQLPGAEGLPLPVFATTGAAGMDVYAALPEDGPIGLDPMKRELVPTGLAVAVPPGYEMQVRPRSGLAWKNGITVLNGPGTIDADYRGEVRVMLINLGDAPFTIKRGDKIAQLVIARYAQVTWQETGELPATDRGAGGFGSTGV